MGNIKVRDKEGNWVVVASNQASGMAVDDPALVEEDEKSSVQDVLVNHEERVAKLERNVSWLAKHGGGGSGGSGGGTDITEATCNIFANNVGTGNAVILNENGLTIELRDISVKATKVWKVTVRIGSIQVASGSASFTSPTITIPFSTISSALINHTGNMYISASYEDETNGVYGSASWSGTITESVVNLSTPNLDIGLTDDGDLESDESLIYTYSVGIIGEYTLKIDVTKDGSSVVSKTYPISIIDTNQNTFSVRVAELLSKFDVGVYVVKSQLYYNDNQQIQNSITSSLTLVSKSVLISSTVMSEDQSQPTEVSLSGSINLVWTAYLQGSTTFQYNYKIGSTTIKEDTIGYFGEEINDFISVIGKDWAIENQVTAIKLTVNVGNDTATKTWYVKFVKFKNDFLPKSTTVEGHLISEFLARTYNNGDQTFNMVNENYLVGGRKTKVTSKITMANTSNLVGVKTSTNNAPYMRVSNGAYAKLGSFNIGGTNKTFANIIAGTNNDFTISISFKADYHPDDERTILCVGQVDSQTGQLITGFEIDVHDIYVNTSSLLRLTDNTVNNVDIVCVHSDDKYIDSSGEGKQERHYIIKIYLEGALSAVDNYSIFPTVGDEIYIGGKVYGDTTDSGWLCDCNIYNLQVYDYALTDFDIVSNYINNRVSSTYKDGGFDFSIIDSELRKNFCERGIDGQIISYLYQNGAYTVDFLLDGANLSEEKLNQYAKAVGIPVMLIDVSTDDSWTFENFVNQQTADNVQLQPTSGKTISYWDPTQQNTSVLQVHNSTIELQGTSTLADAVKNINITVPNDTAFIPKDTWLPEQTYTLKADVVDSSHSNNASIGKFINTVLKDYFPSDPIALDNVENSEYVKNQQPTATLKHTVEGFPILLIMNFHTTETSKVSTTPLGIYSFNLGRDAFRNLGFRKVNKITDSLGQNINATTFPYLAEGCTFTEEDSNANWVEIKDTTSIIDMSKIEGSSLPADFDSSAGDFWQNDDTILDQRYEVRYPQGRQASDYTIFKNFVGTVMSLPLEGLYVTRDRIGNIDRPEITTEYDLYTYNNGYVKTGKKQQIITDVNQLAALGFNATSMYKYFVIANMFGLADNFGKNSTFRSWQNGDYYIGFYDMDTALGGGNQGTLSIEPNMWMKYLKNQILEGKNYGFVAETFDFEDELRLSNTVFSANHNKLWLSMDTNLMRNKVGINEIAGTSAYSYYWDDFRTTLYSAANKAGYKDSAEYFVNEFYLKQTGECGPLLFNLDYKLKYLVQFTDDKYSNTKHLSKLHGRKTAYTLNWLRKHILFLDSVFYWRNTAQKFSYPNDVNCKMSSTVYNTPEYIPIKSNTDIIAYYNVGNATQTYYYLPKNKEVYVDAGNNNSNSEVTWGITNSPQIIQIGSDEVPLSKMNIYKISHTNTELYANNPGLTAITELELQESNSLAAPFGLDSYQPEIGVSEIRSLNFANTQSRLIQGIRPTFTLELVKQLAGGQTDTKFTKLREIDISNSQCVSDITIPSIPLKRLAVYNSALTNLNLDNQNYIESVDLTGCTKLIKITIRECAAYKTLNVSNLNNLQEVNIVNNKSLTSITINNCSNLQKVTIQNNGALTTINITSCTKLTGTSGTNYLTITDNKVLKVINLSNCTKLNKFTISNSNQANITTLNLQNVPLTSISGDGVDETLLDLSKFTYGSGITLTGNKKVEYIQLANDKAKPITMTATFQNCTKLIRVYGCLILKPSSGPNGAGMFRGCNNFTIHGDDTTENKCLGVKTWNGKSTRAANGVKTIYGIITNDDYNYISNGKRPYASVTWDQSFVSGKKVTNFKMGNNAVGYMFYQTHVTQFDVMYMLFVIGQTVTTNFTLERTFFSLIRKSGELNLFDTSVHTYGMLRHTFYKLDKCTAIIEGFTCAKTIVRSKNTKYNETDGVDDKASNGVLSFFTNCTSIVRLSSSSIIVDRDVFKINNGNLKISSFTYQGVENVTDIQLNEDDNNEWHIISNYNSWKTSKKTQLGNFTDIFNALPNLTTLYDIFDCQYIDFDTLSFPSKLNSIRHCFNATSGGRGTIDIKTIFSGCSNLNNVTHVFETATDTSYGEKAEFPITADMFAAFPNLTKFGYDPSDTNQNDGTYVAKNARRYIVDATFPENILSNNPNIQVFSHVFYDCESKDFASVPKFPGTMFSKATKLQNINSILRNAHFAFTLSPNGFANCPNLNNVGRAFQCASSSTKTNRSKLTGEIPAKLFFHGSSSSSSKIYGTSQSEKPGEDFDVDTNLEEYTVKSTVVRIGITDMKYCFSGCLNLSYYTNKDNIDMVEDNPDYSPFKWIYNKTSKTWAENNETKQKIAYWGYTGDPSTQNSSCKYLEDANIELITEGGVANKLETLNYMCAPDLLRYANANCNIEGLFQYCGLDFTTYGIINSDENYQSAGITGRIPPYLLRPVSAVTNINYIFQYCRRLSSYKQEGVIYQIPKDFFSYATGITTLLSAFQGLDFVSGTNLAVFTSLKNSLDVRKIFCFARYFKNNSTKQTINNVFKNNQIIKLTGAFSENNVTLNGDYNATTRNHWTLDNADNVSAKDNFQTGKVPSEQNINYVYYGMGTANASDAAIPTDRGNNY